MNLYLVGWRAVSPLWGPPDRWGQKEVTGVEIMAIGRDVILALDVDAAKTKACKKVPILIDAPDSTIQIRYVMEKKL